MSGHRTSSGKLCVEVGPRELALTFDDGPEEIWTNAVLELLRRHEARATFFVEAPRARQRRDLIERMLTDGHEVAFHCVEHRGHDELSAVEIHAEAERGLMTMAELEVRPHAWRPPWGRLGEHSFAIASEFGLELWGWSHDSHDWRGDSHEQMLAEIAPQGITGGAVVLMHDGIGPGARRQGCAETLALADLLLCQSRRSELSPVTLSTAPL